MDAIILAAGLGTRLRPHTLKTPKPLLSIQGRPILDWTLGALPRSVDRVIIVINYLAEQIRDFMHDQRRVRQWAAVVQDEPRGTGDALRSCLGSVESHHFLVLNGDDLYGAADLSQLAQKHAGILVHPVDEPSRFGIAYLKADGTLDRLLEKPDLSGTRLANTGAYLFPREVFDIPPQLSLRGEYEITDYVSGLAEVQPVQVVQAGFWLPIGTVETFEQAQQMDLAGWLTQKG